MLSCYMGRGFGIRAGVAHLFKSMSSNDVCVVCVENVEI